MNARFMVHDKSNYVDLYVFVMQAEADSLSWNGAIKRMFVFLGCSAKFCIRSWGRLHWKQKSTSQSSKECVKLALLFTPCQNTHTLSRTRYRTRTLAHALSTIYFFTLHENSVYSMQLKRTEHFVLVQLLEEKLLVRVQENFSDFWIDSIWKTWNWFFLVFSCFKLCSLIERTSEIT